VEWIIFGFILEKCANLQILNLDGSIFPFPLTEQKEVPYHFLTHSLKRLFLRGSQDPGRMMKAQNMIWILVFCVHLRQASLSFTLRLDGYTFLLKYWETFKGLSRVKQLALGPRLHWDETPINNRGWLGRKWSKELVGGNVETTAVHHFLQFTNSLDSLEIAMGAAITISGDDSIAKMSVDCLSSLSNSYSSIKHLRLTNLRASQSSKMDLSIFTNLKTLSLDFLMLYGLKTGKPRSSLSSVKILHLPYYAFDDSFAEDRFLSDTVSSGILSNLAEIVLPSRPIGPDSREAESSHSVSVRLWKESRELLRENERIKNGKVKLRTL